MLCRRVVCVNTHRLIFCQKLLSTTENFQTIDNTETTFDEGSEKKISKRKTRARKSKEDIYYSKEIYNFLQKRAPQYVEFIPKCLMRRCSKNNIKLYIVDEGHAKTLASMISKEMLNDSSHVIDCTPGLGLLTKELLRAGVPFVNLYEMNKTFYEADSPLSVLMNYYPNKLKLYQLNFTKVFDLLLKYEFSEIREIEDYFVDIPYCQEKSKSYVQIMDFSATRNPIALMMYNFFKQTHLFERGRPCFYIGAPSPAWNNLIKVEGTFYSQYSVMFNLFFDIKHLGELPRNAFLPWPREKYWKMDNLDTPIYILKLEPKNDMFDILSKDDLKSFWFFLKYCMKTRKNKVLAEFEKLAPGSGVKLIQKDYGILTTFKELPPLKLLEIFKMYRSWPEYDEVLFNFSLSPGEGKKGAEKLEELEVEVDESLEEFEQEPVDSDIQALSAEDKQEDGET